MSDPIDPVVSERAHERTDCALYHACLHDAAKGKKRSHGGDDFVPCVGCSRYQASPRARIDGWVKPGDRNPWNTF